MGDLVDVARPAKSNLKKKSTLNRLADMISKSPILEPLRNRPKRGGSTLIARARESVTQHDDDGVGMLGAIDVDVVIWVLINRIGMKGF